MHKQLVGAATVTGLVAAALSALTLVPGIAVAAEAPAKGASEPSEKSIYDRIWGLATLYKNADNPWIQEFAIVGRQQMDWFVFDEGEREADNFVNRRSRIGFKARAFQDFTIHSEVDLNLEGSGEVYTKMTDAYIKWSPEKWFNFTVGKHGAKFTLDGGTSSTQLITIDRSNIANNFWFPEEYMPGVSVSGEYGNWIYNVGYFSSGDADSEFGDFNGGSFVLLSGGYNLAKTIGVDKAVVRLDYVYQDPSAENGFTRANEQVGSLNFWLEHGRWGFGSDLVGSDGYGSQNNMLGLQLMPFVKFCESWQGVFRYTYIEDFGNPDDSIRLARYENRIESGRADEYNEAYLGLNKYFYGHKLKWQTGLQYTSAVGSSLNNGKYDGWGVTTGLRISW